MRLFHMLATHSPLRTRFPGIDLNTALARIATLHAGLLRPWSAQDGRHEGRSTEREAGHDIKVSGCRNF